MIKYNQFGVLFQIKNPHKLSLLLKKNVHKNKSKTDRMSLEITEKYSRVFILTNVSIGNRKNQKKQKIVVFLSYFNNSMFTPAINTSKTVTTARIISKT